MSLIRWNPTRELTAWPQGVFGMQREINRLFEDTFRGGMRAEENTGKSFWTPAVDIAEQQNEYVVKMELPGINKEDVKITLESNVLTIRGEKKQEKETREGSYRRAERSYGSFQRSFTLSTTVKSDRIDAFYKDGVLTVTLPKVEEAKPVQIEVKVK
ncbi:MAG: Hsp20/alpha crystallin family protein [Ignavibacteriales bacterium]|nr:Hsp20/alpha crystallin family protein [Ignavibacteriales bacterium]